MLCIGLEGTAHTLGIGVIDSDGKIYANIRSEYVPKSGGIHPREAAQHHGVVLGPRTPRSEVLKEPVPPRGLARGLNRQLCSLLPAAQRASSIRDMPGRFESPGMRDSPE